MRRFLIVFAIAVLAPLAGLAQQSALDTRDPRQAQDAEFAALVKEWTTKPEFMSPLVDHLPVAEGVPSPKAILGYHIGAPKKLTYYADMLRYYRALDAASPRVSIESIGTTDEGREMIVVYVSDEAGIRDLQTHKDGYAKLADPRTLSEAEVRGVIAATKPMYQMMGGLHSGETGPSEMLMELAYRLAVETSPLISQIRDNVIVAITPVADADGRDRYVDWYYRHLIQYDTTTGRPGGPPYWGKYVFHDNNRDINYSQVSMRNLLDWYMRTKPPIMHDLHESIPFLYTYSGQAPQNPNLDPILFAELPMFSNFEMAQMIKYGMPGVWTHGFMDGWSPGYLGSMSYNHNGLMRMYETFGNGGANTMKRTVGGGRGGGRGEGGRGGGRGGGQASREWYRPLPPYSEVVWSMRNNTNYMQTGVLTALQFTASFPKMILENFYTKTVNSIEGGKTIPPHAFVIPGGQKDPTRVAVLVNLLRLQGIEVGLSASPIKVKDKTYPAGSYVIKRDQPYGRLAKILLEEQEYPDPALRTYDDSGWTMGHMLHTEVIAVDDSSILDVPVALVSKAEVTGRVGGRGGAALVVAHYGSNNMVTLRHRLKGMSVKTTEQPFKAGDVEYPSGSFVIPSAGNDLAKARAEIEALGLTAGALDIVPDVPMHEADLPRIAMYSTWTSTQEVGWVRHAFDQFEIPFDLIYKERIGQGNLRRDYDVILIPSQAGSGRAFVERAPASGKPIAYTKTEEFKFLGAYGSSEDIRGGFGLEGVLEFQKFADAGGTLITLGAASYFPAEFGLAPNVTAARPSNAFYAPRPIVNAEIMRTAHPIFYGYDEKVVPTKYTNGPLLSVSGSGAQAAVLMRYPGGDDNVLSGLMRGANEVRNRAAIVDVPNGKGRVLVYATNPVYRWQNHGEFNMLFNALLNWNDIKAGPPEKETEG